MLRKIWILIPLSLLTLACGGNGPAREAAQPSAYPAEVTWFDGTVEEAFALAAEEDRPLFLYWGAVWCPPCHYLKTKIFHRPEFVERSANFVMVYLDGDSERAQVYGDKFGTSGYPTVIIFGPDGEERMRMPSSVEPELYAELLDEAMTMRPIAEVLAAVRESGPAEAAPGDLHLLAFYSWDQDRVVDLPDSELLEIFHRLYRETPVDLEVEKSRFLTLYLGAILEQGEATEEGGAVVLEDEERADLESAVRALLADPELRAANLSFLFYGSADTVALLTSQPGARRDELVAAWERAAHQVEGDEGLPIDDRLSGLLPRLALARLVAEPAVVNGEEAPEAALPPKLVAEVRRRVAWAVDTVTDPGELQTVLNTAAYLLEKVDLPDEAESLLIAHMEKAQAPWYFMGWVGGLREDAGATDEALDWYRKAHAAAVGRYTRFRWGSSYLRHLMKLTPDDETTIGADSERILAELLTLSDAFAHGNLYRLQQLDEAYREWNEDGSHAAIVEAVRAQVHAACDGFPDEGEDSQAERCRGFLGEKP